MDSGIGPQGRRYGLWLGGRVWILGVWGNVLLQTPIQVFSQSTWTCFWNWNKNHPAIHPGFREEDKDKYIEDYRRAEGITLEKASISKNEGQRTLAKLKLNSMWGKWVQNQNNTQTTIVNSENEFYERLTSPGTEVTNLILERSGGMGHLEIFRGQSPGGRMLTWQLLLT